MIRKVGVLALITDSSAASCVILTTVTGVAGFFSFPGTASMLSFML